MEPILNIGTKIDNRYEITDLLGQGGMGTVYKALELSLNREVAIKFLHSHLLSESDTLARFEREAKIMLDLTHRNILRCYRYGLWQHNLPYIVTEYLEGDSLASLLNRTGVINWQQLINLAKQMATGLSFAHKAGVVHRDFKPTNLLILKEQDGQTIKILDFGLARLTELSEEGKKLTQTGVLLGSPQYMSPEQCLGRVPDSRSDIYSFGCVLFEMLCGRPPYIANAPLSYLHMHTNTPPPPLLLIGVNERAPMALVQLLYKCLAKNPDDRFQTCQELTEILSLIESGREKEIDLNIVIPKQKKKAPVVVAVLIAIFLAFFTTILISYVKRAQPSKQAGWDTKKNELSNTNALRISSRGKVTESDDFDDISQEIKAFHRERARFGPRADHKPKAQLLKKSIMNWLTKHGKDKEQIFYIIDAYLNLDQLSELIDRESDSTYRYKAYALLPEAVKKEASFPLIRRILQMRGTFSAPGAKNEEIVRQIDNYLREQRQTIDRIGSPDGEDQEARTRVSMALVRAAIDNQDQKVLNSELDVIYKGLRSGHIDINYWSLVGLIELADDLISRGYFKEAENLTDTIFPLVKGAQKATPESSFPSREEFSKALHLSTKNRTIPLKAGQQLGLNHWPIAERAKLKVAESSNKLHMYLKANLILNSMQAPFRQATECRMIEITSLNGLSIWARQARMLDLSAELKDEIERIRALVKQTLKDKRSSTH